VTTIGEQAFKAILTKPSQEWTDDESRAFDAYLKTGVDEDTFWDSMAQAHAARLAYRREHPEDTRWVPSEEWTIEERVGFQESLFCEFPEDEDTAAVSCWALDCGHPVTDHDADHPDAPCRTAACSCAFLVQPKRLDLACVCGHTMGKHGALGCRLCPGTACQFTAAAAVAIT